MKLARRRSLERLALAALFACSMVLHSQGPAPAAVEQAKSAALPAAPDAPASAFTRSPGWNRISTPSGDPGASLALGSRYSVHPFQPAAGFENPAASAPCAPRFDAPGGFGAVGRSGSGFNPSGTFSLGARQGSTAALFPAAAPRAGGPLGAAPQPSFNQLMRSTINLPLGSSQGSAFRFQYSTLLQPAGGLGDPAHPYGSVLFTSPDLGNGVFLSAGTYNSGHSTAGAPPAAPGSNIGAPKRSASGVAIKLSF